MSFDVALDLANQASAASPGWAREKTGGYRVKTWLIVGFVAASVLSGSLTAAAEEFIPLRADRGPARRPAGQWSVKTPEPPEVRQHIDRAQAAAGRQWANVADYFCRRDGIPDAPDDPVITPMKIFDDVYIVGNGSNVVYILKTSAGLVLIDNYYPQGRDTVLLPGLKALGFEPADVKYIFITHGHTDHFGSAGWFQQKYGTRVVESEADWKLIESTPSPLPPGDNPAPRRDLIARDGTPIVIGGVAVTPVAIPGHTPGSMGYIFPVMDKGRAHMAANFGSSVLLVQSPSKSELQAHIDSVAHFAEATRAAGVDVELQNHPIYDDMWAKVSGIGTRQQNGGVNPLVVGKDSYQTFMLVMSECLKAEMARRD